MYKNSDFWSRCIIFEFVLLRKLSSPRMSRGRLTMSRYHGDQGTKVKGGLQFTLSCSVFFIEYKGNMIVSHMLSNNANSYHMVKNLIQFVVLLVNTAYQKSKPGSTQIDQTFQLVSE